MSSYWKRLSTNGPVLIFLSAIGFGLMAASVKGAAPLPSAEVSLFRFLIALGIMGILHWRGIFRLEFHNRPYLALRGLLAGGAVLCFFGAIERIPVGAATLFNNCFPFFAVLAAILTGQEKGSFTVVFALGLAFLGMFVILAPKIGAIPFETGTALGLTSALLAGAAFVVIRELRRTDSAAAIYTAMCTGGVLLALPLALAHFEMPTLRQWGWLVLVAVSSTVAQILMNHAMRYLSASAGSIMAAGTTAFATLFGFLLFGESYRWTFFLGAGLIFAAAVFVARQGKRNPGLSSDVRLPVE